MRAATKSKVASAGTGSGPDAVRDACRDAVGGLDGDASLMLAFVSGDRDYERDAKQLADLAQGAAHSGMTGAGLIGPSGPVDEGCTAIAFGDRVQAAVAAAENASEDLRAAGKACTSRAIERLGTEPDLVLLFIDTTRGDMAETVSGAYEAAGPAIPLAGGAAGGAEKRHFHGGRATADSVVAVSICSEGGFGIGDTQTCKPRGTPSIVTRAEGQRVEEIDGRPAEEVYLEQLGFTGVAFDGEEFDAMAMTHPIAQPELHGDFRLRHVLTRTGEGGIVLGSSIPESAVIEFTELDYDQLLASGAGSVRAAIGGLGGASPQAALVFDCAGRRRALRDGVPEEVEAIRSALGEPSPPTVGLYTHGEVARLRGAKGDRNHAVVTVTFG